MSIKKIALMFLCLVQAYKMKDWGFCSVNASYGLPA